LTAYNVIDPSKMVALQPEDVSVILANLQAIAGAINGSLDNANLSPGASIAISKLAGYPGDAGKVLLGDGSWADLGTGTVGETVPSAVVLPFAGSVAPSGFLMCDGAAVSRTTYSALFALIGTTYGVGDGSSTFNVPDIQGRMVVGKGTHPEVDTLGENDGLPVGNRTPRHNSTLSGALSYTQGVLPNHYHSHSLAAGAASGPGGGSAVRAVTAAVANTDSPSYDIATQVSGGVNDVSLNAGASVGGSVGLGSLAVGPGGTRPTDAPATIVLNHIIKT
jgi:microcystin-dependent protein